MKAKEFLIGIAALTLSLPAEANIIIGLEPSSASINPGSDISVDLVVSGLGNHASPSVGAFEFNLSYDSAVLSAACVTFGNQLNQGILGSLANFDLSTPGMIHMGTVHLDEVSLETVATLIANQPSSFTLATLEFKGVGAGVSPISVASGSLADETGLHSLLFTATPGKVEVSGAAVTVPDASSTASALAIALLSLGALRRRLL